MGDNVVRLIAAGLTIAIYILLFWVVALIHNQLFACKIGILNVALIAFIVLIFAKATAITMIYIAQRGKG